MADLRSRFIEDYAGGLLNVSRQEFSTSGEVASQDGLPTDGGTLFVEDGTGTKSGLKLGAGLVESVDPTTENSCVNVRFADRTYAKLRDLKLFTTAIASAQAALSEATSTSITNLEVTLELLETDISSLQQSIQTDIYDTRNKLEDLIVTTGEISSKTTTLEQSDLSLQEADLALKSANESISLLVADTRSKVEGLTETANGLSTRVSALEQSNLAISSAVGLMDLAVKDLISKVTSLEERVTSLETPGILS